MQTLTEKIAKEIARSLARRFRWVDRDDLEQEARLAMHLARNTWTTAVGVPWEHYARRAAFLAARHYAYGQIMATSTSRLREERYKTAKPVELRDFDLPDDRLYGESGLDAMRRQRKLRARITDLISTVDGHHLALPVVMRTAQSKEVAEAHGVPVEHVYRATQQVRNVLRNDQELWLMHKEEE